MVQVKCKFASWAGCELHSLRYAGDACNSAENLKWLNSLDEGKNYVQAIELLTDFHSPKTAYGAWEEDQEYTDYQWWLARTADGGWQLLSWGYYDQRQRAGGVRKAKKGVSQSFLRHVLCSIPCCGSIKKSCLTNNCVNRIIRSIKPC